MEQTGRGGRRATISSGTGTAAGTGAGADTGMGIGIENLEWVRKLLDCTPPGSPEEEGDGEKGAATGDRAGQLARARASLASTEELEGSWRERRHVGEPVSTQSSMNQESLEGLAATAQRHMALLGSASSTPSGVAPGSQLHGMPVANPSTTTSAVQEDLLQSLLKQLMGDPAAMELVMGAKLPAQLQEPTRGVSLSVGNERTAPCSTQHQQQQTQGKPLQAGAHPGLLHDESNQVPSEPTTSSLQAAPQAAQGRLLPLQQQHHHHHLKQALSKVPQEPILQQQQQQQQQQQHQLLEQLHHMVNPSSTMTSPGVSVSSMPATTTTSAPVLDAFAGGAEAQREELLETFSKVVAKFLGSSTASTSSQGSCAQASSSGSGLPRVHRSPAPHAHSPRPSVQSPSHHALSSHAPSPSPLGQPPVHPASPSRLPPTSSPRLGARIVQGASSMAPSAMQGSTQAAPKPALDPRKNLLVEALSRSMSSGPPQRTQGVPEPEALGCSVSAAAGLLSPASSGPPSPNVGHGMQRQQYQQEKQWQQGQELREQEALVQSLPTAAAHLAPSAREPSGSAPPSLRSWQAGALKQREGEALVRSLSAAAALLAGPVPNAPNASPSTHPLRSQKGVQQSHQEQQEELLRSLSTAAALLFPHPPVQPAIGLEEATGPTAPSARTVEAEAQSRQELENQLLLEALGKSLAALPQAQGPVPQRRGIKDEHDSSGSAGLLPVSSAERAARGSGGSSGGVRGPISSGSNDCQVGSGAAGRITSPSPSMRPAALTGQLGQEGLGQAGLGPTKLGHRQAVPEPSSSSRGHQGVPGEQVLSGQWGRANLEQSRAGQEQGRARMDQAIEGWEASGSPDALRRWFQVEDGQGGMKRGRVEGGEGWAGPRSMELTQEELAQTLGGSGFETLADAPPGSFTARHILGDPSLLGLERAGSGSSGGGGGGGSGEGEEEEEEDEFLRMCGPGKKRRILRERQRRSNMREQVRRLHSLLPKRVSDAIAQDTVSVIAAAADFIEDLMRGRQAREGRANGSRGNRGGVRQEQADADNKAPAGASQQPQEHQEGQQEALSVLEEAEEQPEVLGQRKAQEFNLVQVAPAEEGLLQEDSEEVKEIREQVKEEQETNMEVPEFTD